MPDNKLPTQETINREKVTQKIQSLNHREKSVTLRSNSSVVIRTSVDLECPFCGKFYATIGPLENHLHNIHKIDEDKAKIICKSTNATQTLVNALKQRVHRQQRLHQWDVLKDLHNYDPEEKKTKELLHQKIPTQCSECKNLKGRKECGLCKVCCLNKGGCNHHFRYYKVIDSLQDYSVIIADCETTDFKVRSLTDFYADNLSNNSTIEFPQFIRPRRKIEKSVVELTNISNEMVLNGVHEDQAISRLVAELPKKAIIMIAHNSPFDKDAIFKAYMYWRQKKLLQSNFKENRLIFVDSLGIIKQKLLEKLENYKLGTIFKTLFDRDIVDQHRAKSDVIALKQILQHPRIFGNDVINSVKRYLSEITIEARDCIVFDANGNKLCNDDLIETRVLGLIENKR
ncbi:hypothetical protein FDP41_013751 [Naegleria fowleri]|uniref:C2H2-type domain-containing protein n=1 Tax=Naegleria fowleri TaxID=5763 RepID=A0A6A5BTL7_NAEFO|nr:uncharacterized protein FDP41_013751 [Naegleria fowleri]KAF0980537.1 hypothetical protein FDP41_013751 [Naegleria fowleri]